jgi:hypothetical protein
MFNRVCQNCGCPCVDVDFCSDACYEELTKDIEQINADERCPTCGALEYPCPDGHDDEDVLDDVYG